MESSNKTEKDECILESRVKYDQPPEKSNMARELLEAFRRHSNRTLLAGANNEGKTSQWTGAQVLAESGRIATGLIQHAQVKPGQTVSMFCDHTAEEVLFGLGAILAGAALMAQQPDDGYEELLTTCRLVKPDVIVVSSREHRMAAQLRLEVNPNAVIIWLDNPFKCLTTDETVSGALGNNSTSNNNNNSDLFYYLDLIKQDKVVLADNFNSLDEPLLDAVAYEGIDAKEHKLSYMLTSGSTGRPKMVASTHDELVFGLYSLVSATRNEVSGMKPASYLLPLTANSVLAGDLPLDHGAGLNTMFLSLYIGAKFIVMPSYHVDAFWQAVNDNGITASISSTTFTFKLLTRLKQLIADGESDKWDLSKFDWLACCGSKLAFTDLVIEICSHYKNLHIVQGYGATEIGFMSMLLKEDSRTHLHSTGHLFPGMRAKLVDRSSCLPISHKQVQKGVRGELHMWARSKFQEYRCHADDDAGALVAACHDSEGFYKTGDQVHFDSAGRLYVHGRFKDTLYLADDWKILPSELEEIIDRHPFVEQSAVIGVPDLDSPGCDAPRAFVKLISVQSAAFKQLQSKNNPLIEHFRDKDLLERDISDFVLKQVAKCKQLKGGVMILDEFPRNGVLNKIDRKALKLIK